jgi:hypothetical protein
MPARHLYEEFADPVAGSPGYRIEPIILSEIGEPAQKKRLTCDQG